MHSMHALKCLAIMISSLVLGLSASPLLMALAAMALPGRAGAFIALNVPHIATLASMAILCPLLLRRSIWSILTDSGRPRMGLFLTGAGSAIAVIALAALLEGGYEVLESDASERFILAILAFILTPLQCLCEEVLTRALPARIAYPEKLGGSAARSLAATVACGLLFIIMHLANSEWEAGCNPMLLALYYFSFAALSCAVGIITGGFELAWGIHSANNLAIALFFGYRSMPYDTLPLLWREETGSLPLMLLELVAIFALATLPLLRHLRNRKRKC